MSADDRPGLIDIGANLGHESFRHDLDAVLERARAAGLEAIVLTGTDPESNQRALELSQRHPEYFRSTAGLHPHEARRFDTGLEAGLKKLAAHEEVRAIGETGLDFNRDYSPRPAQELAFTRQLGLAAELGMPAFLHQRDAHERFLPILKEYRDRLPRAVVHCFTGSREELHDYLDLDLYIGITGWICDERRGHDLHPLIREIPADRLLLETDAPYLLPRTIRPRPRGRRNEPAYLPWVLATVVSCLDRPASEIARETSRNARLFFGL